MFCATAQHCMIHHTVYNKVNHSTAASQERTPAKLPAVPNMLACVMGITCVEDLPDRDHTVWEVKEPATAKLSTWLPLLYAPRNCQSRSHCDPLTTAEQTIVGILYCGVRLYLVAAGYEDAQGVSNCGDSCSPERWFHLMRRDKIPFRFILYTFNGYFNHHFPDMDVSVSVCLLLKYTFICTRSTPGCTSNPDVHMKTSLHTHK